MFHITCKLFSSFPKKKIALEQNLGFYSAPVFDELAAHFRAGKTSFPFIPVNKRKQCAFYSQECYFHIFLWRQQNSTEVKCRSESRNGTKVVQQVCFCLNTQKIAPLTLHQTCRMVKKRKHMQIALNALKLFSKPALPLCCNGLFEKVKVKGEQP